MAKWRVNGTVTGGKYLGTYEAETAEQAEEMAMEAEGTITFCHECSKNLGDFEITKALAELDEEEPR